MSGNAKKYWNRYYRTSFTYDPRRDAVWRGVCAYLQEKYIPEEARILDAGAGYCNFINNIRGAERHAIDIIEGLSEYAAPGVSVHVQSSTALDLFADGFFDVIFASNLLEHLTRDETDTVLREFWRTLREGGKLILLQPNFRYCYRTYFDDYTHLQIFTERSLAELLEAYDFRIADIQARFLPVNMKTTLRYTPPRLDLLVKAYLHLPFKPRAGQMLVVAEKQKRSAP